MRDRTTGSLLNNTKSQQDVHVRVRYAISSLCAGGCLTTQDMYVLQTNEVNQSFVRKNVSVFKNEWPIAALTGIRDSRTIVTRVVSRFIYKWILYSIRDLGTCVVISELVAYYPIYNATSLDFGTNFSMNQFLGGNSVGSCFANMSIDLNISSNVFIAWISLTIYW